MKLEVQVIRTFLLTHMLLQNNQIHSRSSQCRIFCFETLSPFSLFTNSFVSDTFLSFPNIRDMTTLLSNIINAIVGQLGVKQNQSVELFTLVEGRPTKVGIARIFGESRKIVRCINATAFPRDKGEDPVTIHYSTVNQAYAEIRDRDP